MWPLRPQSREPVCPSSGVGCAWRLPPGEREKGCGSSRGPASAVVGRVCAYVPWTCRGEARWSPLRPSSPDPQPQYHREKLLDAPKLRGRCQVPGQSTSKLKGVENQESERLSQPRRAQGDVTAEHHVGMWGLGQTRTLVGTLAKSSVWLRYYRCGSAGSLAVTNAALCRMLMTEDSSSGVEGALYYATFLLI